jgi:hypothetical protein
MKTVISILLAVVLWQIQAQAQFSIILCVATNGNDTLGNGSTSAPFASIQKAVDTAPTNGALISVLPGTYSGTGNHNINLDGKAVTIRSTGGPGVTTLNCQQNQAFIAQSTETTNTVIDGLTITNGFVSSGQDWSGSGIIFIQAPAGLNIRNCIFTKNSTLATYVTTSTSIILEVNDPTNVTTVENCLFYANSVGGGGWTYTGGGSASIIGSGGGTATIKPMTVINCTIASNNIYSSVADWGNYGGGVRGAILNPDGVTENTIAWGNSPPNAPTTWSYPPYVMWCTSVSYSIADGLTATNGIGVTNSDPLFVNPAAGDFSTATNSPARNAGDPSLANNPDGTRSDIGWRPDRFFGASPSAHPAHGTATLSGVFVVGVSITDGGYGYTNTPLVRLIGGGGSGAEAVAVVSNGVVTAVNVLDAGYGYTNAPLVIIEPPFILNPVLGIAPMSFLSFSNLTVGGTYQLQQSLAWYWTNQPVSFTATNSLYTQMVAGVWGSGNYRLALNPVPSQAFATPQVVNGFVVGATLTSGGSGYVTSPAVSIVGGHGTNATAVSLISGGVVKSISITDAGLGYTNTPTIQIAAPPAAAVFPAVQPVMRVDSSSLAPYDNYQIQFKPDIVAGWINWDGGLFSPTNVTNSQFLFITNGMGFFRLQYMP